MFQRLRLCIVEFSKLFVNWTLVFFQLFYGVWKMTKIPKPRVTFFGGTFLPQDHPYTKMARALAKKLAENEISVITGGGPGIMEAANCGARDGTKEKNVIRSMAVGVKDLPGEKGVNVCAQEYILLKYFFARKWLLIQYSEAFLVFPGGYGTLDELTEVLTLIQTKKLGKVPVILFGKDYWKIIMDFIEAANKLGLINDESVKLITITDDPELVFCMLKEKCQPEKKIS